MNLEELNIILLRGENIRTEYKEARDKVPGSFYHTVVSFLDREGGVIVLGSDDDGVVTADHDTFLFQKGSSWVEKGGKLKNLRMNNINDLQFCDFQKGGSWVEKGVKLLPDKPNSPDQKMIKIEELHKQVESQRLEFKTGTGFFRIQAELQNSPELRFTLESLNGFTRCGLDVAAQDTEQPGEQDADPVGFAEDPTKTIDKLGDRLGDKLGDNQKLILDTIRNNPTISLSQLSKKIGISQTTLENNVAKLKEKGLIKRIGSAKGGHWEIMKRAMTELPITDNRQPTTDNS